MSSPRVSGAAAEFISVTDETVPWIPVRSQRNADGTESHVWEKWVAFSSEPMFLALFAKWDPGMIIRRHGHYSQHTLIVLAGSMTTLDSDGSEQHCGVGAHISLPVGASFGPFVAGPQGTRLYEVMMGDPRSWSDEPDALARVLAEHNVTQLPDPPIELPGGLEDLRAVFDKAAAADTKS